LGKSNNEEKNESEEDFFLTKLFKGWVKFPFVRGAQANELWRSRGSIENSPIVDQR